MNIETLAKTLGRVWHFRHLKLKDLQLIVSAGQMMRFQAESIIFQETEQSAGMFVLLSGKVHLCKLSPNGQEQIISIIRPVIMFNELTAIDDGPNPYTAIAIENCNTWNIKHQAFHDLVNRYPDPNIGLGLLKILASRTRLLINRCEDLSFRPVLARTAKLMLDLSVGGSNVIDRSEHPIKDMSANIATVPEAISRSLTNLKEDCLVEVTRTHIRVLDVPGLAKIAQIEDPLITK
jgi:CRP-like cAMP-binding protein